MDLLALVSLIIFSPCLNYSGIEDLCSCKSIVHPLKGLVALKTTVVHDLIPWSIVLVLFHYPDGVPKQHEILLAVTDII